jgi:hypothetical protein
MASATANCAAACESGEPSSPTTTGSEVCPKVACPPDLTTITGSVALAATWRLTEPIGMPGMLCRPLPRAPTTISSALALCAHRAAAAEPVAASRWVLSSPASSRASRMPGASTVSTSARPALSTVSIVRRALASQAAQRSARSASGEPSYPARMPRGLAAGGCALPLACSARTSPAWADMRTLTPANQRCRRPAARPAPPRSRRPSA